MGIKIEKAGSNSLYFGILILFIFGCDSRSDSDSNDITVLLDGVVSNYPVKNIDTISPIPRIYFSLTFINDSNVNYDFKFDDLIGDKVSEAEFYATMVCPNGEIIKLPLYGNTSKSVYLKPLEKASKSFTSKPIAIERILDQCGNEYMGRLIEQITKEVIFVYKADGKEMEFKCSRNKFESPEYFMIE